MEAQRERWACPGPHSWILPGLLAPALLPLHYLKVLPQKRCVTFLVSLFRGIYSTCVLRLESGGYEKRNSEQVAEIHVHLCSPISLPSPPSPSFPSLVPNPTSTIPGRHVPRRAFHFHWGLHVVAARPTRVRALVGCKHGDRWCSVKGFGVRDSPWHYSNLPIPNSTSKHVHISMALRN